MLKISILLPTRGRPALVYRLFDSLIETTSNPQNIEVVLYMDHDDTESHAISHPILSIIKIIKRPGNSMGRIMNECYSASTGRYIMLANDDAVFRTKNWDISVIDAFGKFHDDIALVYGNDMDQGERVPTFPIISRNFCKITGGVCPIGYMNLHIESHIYDIYKQLVRHGHNRIIYLEDVIFEHLHYVTGKSQHDNTYVKKDMGADDRMFLSLDEERKNIAGRLTEYIEGVNKNPFSHYNSQKPLVSIVFLVYPDKIDSFISSLYTMINDKIERISFEVIIVSSLPSDRYPKNILSQTGKTRFVYVENETSFSKLCNIGAQESSGNYLIFIDTAVTPQYGWIDAMVKTIEANHDVAVVGCKLINPRNGRIEHAGIGFFNDAEKLKITYIHRGMRAKSSLLNRVREFQAVSKTCMLVKKKAFLDVGGFAEGISIMEDIDLCLKIKEKGMKIMYTPEAVLYGYVDTPLREDHRQSTVTLLSKWADRIKPDLDTLLRDENRQ